VLIHGGGSGVGTAATTLASSPGMRVIVTAGSDEKCARCLAHGADVAINYSEDFVEKARGANVILDHIGARYLPRDLEALALDGRIVIIGSMGGQRKTELDVASCSANARRSSARRCGTEPRRRRPRSCPTFGPLRRRRQSVP
jgi:NADPH:quinone reductase-like Zn-dependent oxidoreductase